MGGLLQTYVSRLTEVGTPHVARGLQLAQERPTATLGVLGAGLVVVWWLRQPRNLPPGPPSLLRVIPLASLSEKFYEDWAKMQEKYGDVFSMYYGGSLMVICSGHSVVREMLTREDFSHRHPDTDDCFDGDLITDFGANYTCEMIETKKHLSLALRSYGTNKNVADDKMREELAKLMGHIQQYKNKPFDIKQLCTLAAANIIMTIMFNKPRSYDSVSLQTFVETIQSWYAALSVVVGRGMLPLPRWIIRRCFKKDREQLTLKNKELRQIIQKEVDEHLENFDADHPRDVVDAMLKKRPADDMGQKLYDTIMILFPDAIDSVSIFMRWVVLYLTKHPEVQRKVQQEIDDVVGKSKMVSLSDKPSLSYTEATMYEVMRICGASNATGDRTCLADVQLNGYNIPAGTKLYASIYSVHMDKRIYQNPHRFQPERFIGPNGKVVNTENVIPFGLGRRMCVGEQLARTELFLFLAILYQRYDTSFPADQPEPTLDREPTPIASPKPFQIVLTER